MRTQSETFHFGTFSGRRQKYDLGKKASMNRFCLSGITQGNESCSAAVLLVYLSVNNTLNLLLLIHEKKVPFEWYGLLLSTPVS